MQFKSSIKKNISYSSLDGFSLIEFIVSLSIMTIGFLGIMTLYIDVVKNYTQTQKQWKKNFVS